MSVKCSKCGTGDDRKRYFAKNDEDWLLCGECAPDGSRRCDDPVGTTREMIAGYLDAAARHNTAATRLLKALL